jgi:hypothetical protein
VLVHPSAIDLSSSILRFLSRRLSERRKQLRTRWRRLSTGRQALLTLAHLRRGDTYSQLAATFRVGIATVHRYIREAVEVLAALAPTLQQASDPFDRTPASPRSRHPKRSCCVVCGHGRPT